ncbi:24497_t:CDS:2 [Racocetra persica]|uniref:24497_t:CDS:1 n=1 Tax=Racocetra persica TaxID=160502 RepID=A0ACA9MEG3_9GLOM|nr:24497_t:CDS:2 [Racocetra persica]
MEKNNEVKDFHFEIDGEIFTKSFEPDVKLEDVRKKLAERRDNWKAEKLLFKQDNRRIYHEDESDYTLNKLRKSDKSIIYVENLLKEIKVHIDDEKLPLSLDPEDKLKDIHTILIEIVNDKVNESRKDFKFRWKNGKFVSEFEVIKNKLKNILVNGNELYITTLQRGKVMIYSGHSKTPSKPLRHILDKGKSLAEIREELENTLIEQSHLYMCPNCCFLDQDKARISISEESNLKLGEILLIEDGKNVLNVIRDTCQEHEHDLIKLINKCGYGFIIKNGSVEQAIHRAFTIVNAPKYRFLEDGGYEESSFECKNEFSDLCDRNFITFGNVKTSILPWVSVFFGVDYRSSLSKLKNHKKAIKYSYAKLRKAYINISKDNISVTPEFNKEVKKALKEETQDKKVENLKKIAEKYGYFYASSVYFGGVIVERLENINQSNEYESSKELDITANSKLKYADVNADVALKRKKGNKKVIDITNYHRIVKGGDESKFKPKDRPEWIDSIKDSEEWKIIEYHKIFSIFSLLEESLQKDVIEALGKRILKVQFESIEFPSKSNQHVYELSNKLDCIPKDSIKDCHIFTTVLKKNKDRHIFSSYVSYDGRSDKPKIIINRVPNTNRQDSTTTAIFKIIRLQDFVIEDFKQKKVKWNNKNPMKKSSVWHSKIDLSTNGSLIDKSLIFKDQTYLNNKCLTKKSIIQYLKRNKYNIDKGPIFINQLFNDTCPNNNCHGIINVSPEHFQLRILNNKSATRKSKISYFRIPQEINVLYS